TRHLSFSVCSSWNINHSVRYAQTTIKRGENNINESNTKLREGKPKCVIIPLPA
ncbi:MAG: hypothetical protein ACI9MF_002667, partial [Gammaproteobacteria bacterium]